ncbi:MAG: Rsd/AlgQ family anti-sigma factor [Moraxellaceae bacterium]|nr:Rsd/AlgQ family anti-sigma factor [Moraxellaceae bacterium]
MLNPSVAPADLHNRVEALVRRWLDERQSLIVLMVALNDSQRRAIDPTPLPDRIQAFCEVLMDYASAGHFEIYDELLAEAEAHGNRHLAEGQRLFQRLQPTLDAIIRFNDFYEDPTDENVLANLPHELTELGLVLENRFELEDRMIALLHNPTPATA